MPHVKLYEAPEGEKRGVIVHVGVTVWPVELLVIFPVDVEIDVTDGAASGRPPMAIIVAIRDCGGHMDSVWLLTIFKDALEGDKLNDEHNPPSDCQVAAKEAVEGTTHPGEK